MRYKVGDKVRVRQWDDMAKESGLNDCGDINNGFTQSMEHFCGRIYEIYKVYNYYYILKDESIVFDWCFTDEMLEDVVSPSLETSSLFSEMDDIRFEFRDNKIFEKPKTPTYIERGKEMKKQMTQRERLEGQLKEYRRDSEIKSIEIIVPGKIVKVTIDNCTNSTYTMKCHKDDEFSLEKAIILAYVKYESEDLTPNGIEYEAEMFTYFKDNMKKLKKAMKVYEIQQKLKALDEEEERIRANKKRKKIAQKKRRAERLAEEKLKETKEAAKIYAEALKSALCGYEISENTVEDMTKDMDVRV